VKMQARSDKTACVIRATGGRIDGMLVVVGVVVTHSSPIFVLKLDSKLENDRT
jgi:hypothetical protein